MRAEFMYIPVDSIAAVLAFYRETLGLVEAWREGDTTVALVLPGTDVQLMLDVAPDGARAGPVFVTDNVRDFLAMRPGLAGHGTEIREIPGGYWVPLQDPGGNPIYVMDQSLDPASPVGSNDGAPEASATDSWASLPEMERFERPDAHRGQDSPGAARDRGNRPDAARLGHPPEDRRSRRRLQEGDG